MDYLVFKNEGLAQVAAEQIYSNMLESVDSPDLLDVTQDKRYQKSQLTQADRYQYGPKNRRFPVFGTNLKTGIKNEKESYTTAWCVPEKTIQGDWVFQKPADSLMGGVKGYTIKPYDPAWFPTNEVRA
jgi:hypothetical protein